MRENETAATKVTAVSQEKIIERGEKMSVLCNNGEDVFFFAVIYPFSDD